MLDKIAMFNLIIGYSQMLGEEDLARLAKMKELCVRYKVNYDDCMKVIAEFDKWEKTND